MSLQFGIVVQNAILEAIASTVGAAPRIQFYQGSVPGFAAAAPNGVKLVEFHLANVWTAAAVSGQKTLSPLPLSALCSQSGTASYFRIVDSAGTCHIQGTITGAGLGGDFELDNPNLTQGQSVVINAWTLIAPGT